MTIGRVGIELEDGRTLKVPLDVYVTLADGSVLISKEALRRGADVADWGPYAEFA